MALHGWNYVIEDGEVCVFEVRKGRSVRVSNAEHSGTGAFDHTPVDAGSPIFNEIDKALVPAARSLVRDQGAPMPSTPR